MMKTFSLVAAAALLIATPACAQSGNSARMIERLRAADTNNDNAVSRQEFLAYRQTQFSRFDRNNDGYITDDDMPRFMANRAPAGMSPADMRAEFDANGDGRVSQSEFVNGPTLVFNRVDANGDNVATEAEFEAAIAQARANHQGT